MGILQSDQARRRYAVACLVGAIAGFISGFVKLGWEIPLPPRTPARNATQPPVQLLQQLGIPEHATHLGYTYNGNADLMWVGFLMHFAFSIAVAIFYCVVAERFPQIKIWQGVAFGLLVWIGFHEVLLPLFGTIPAPWHQPWQEHLSEALGHALWMWVIELVRRDLRSRITRAPDPEATPSPAGSSD